MEFTLTFKKKKIEDQTEKKFSEKELAILNGFIDKYLESFDITIEYNDDQENTAKVIE